MKKSDFWSGFITHAAIVSLIQDFYGKESYIKMIDIGWVSAWISVPLALILLIISFQIREKPNVQADGSGKESQP